MKKSLTFFFKEKRKIREAVPDNNVATLQEELASAKLREAEANLALKDLKSKVAELSAMWQKHLAKKPAVDGSLAAEGATPDENSATGLWEDYLSFLPRKTQHATWHALKHNESK